MSRPKYKHILMIHVEYIRNFIKYAMSEASGVKNIAFISMLFQIFHDFLRPRNEQLSSVYVSIRSPPTDTWLSYSADGNDPPCAGKSLQTTCTESAVFAPTSTPPEGKH